MSPPRISEKAMQAQIVALLRTLGAMVYVLGHPSPNDGRRHRGTVQTPGLPDLWVFLPSFLAIAGGEVTIEVKAPGGRVRAEQEAFAAYRRGAGGEHIIGGYDDVVAWLIRYGYLKEQNVPHYRRPQ